MKKDKPICHDCGVTEGQIHEFGCDMECCPFCGHQLISCNCVYKLLGLQNDMKYSEETYFLPPKVFSEGLSDEQYSRWLGMLEARGRVPFIQYPNLCVRCGKLWPEMFHVPDEEWEHYVQKDMQDEMLCQECYDHIKQVIDTEQAIRNEPAEVEVQA